ncbi:MAG TPA: 30S ribosomal protein S13, partial [Armatimonadota bacterium]|nr:30S ribosomal protein S13 [Armatimonadota bacterium]
MARIAGVDLPRDKRVEVSLTYIYGIGFTTSRKILSATGVDPNTKVRDLTDEELSKLREQIERNHRVEGDLRRDVQLNIRRLM